MRGFVFSWPCVFFEVIAYVRCWLLLLFVFDVSFVFFPVCETLGSCRVLGLSGRLSCLLSVLLSARASSCLVCLFGFLAMRFSCRFLSLVLLALLSLCFLMDVRGGFSGFVVV